MDHCSLYHFFVIFIVLCFPGNMLGFLKHVHMEVASADIQFWNRASDPVLARDPFSSLMWVLFCLPCPFISCEASLLSLVHIFYVVSLVQVCSVTLLLCFRL